MGRGRRGGQKAETAVCLRVASGARPFFRGGTKAGDGYRRKRTPLFEKLVSAVNIHPLYIIETQLALLATRIVVSITNLVRYSCCGQRILG